MARDPYERYMEELEEDIQPQEAPQKAPAKRRRARVKKQDVMLFGSFLLAGILLVSVVIMIFSNIIKPSAPPVSLPASTPGSGIASTPSGSGVESTPTGPVAPDTNAWNLQIISLASPVDVGYQVPELETLAQDNVLYWFDARAIGDLQNMILACNGVSGHSLKLSAAFRSYERQQTLYAYYYDNYKGLGLSDEEAAQRAQEHELPAGSSEHLTGLAVDFITGSVQTASTAFDQTPEFAWLREHAHEYGFILRYPADETDITGVGYEPFHFRWVGADDAKVIMESGVTLEEYTGRVAGAAQPEPEPTPEGGDAPAA